MTDNLFPTDDLFKKETPKIKDPLEDKPHRFGEPLKSGNSNHSSPFQGSTTAGGEGFPQLRFPEFSDNWQEKKLGEVIKFEKKSKRKSGDGQLCGKHKFFVSSQSQTKYIDEVDYKSENLILGTGGNVSIHIAKEFSTSSDTFIFHSKDINVLNRYIYIFLNRERKLLETGFKGMGIKHLSKEFLINFSISLPSVLEQTKITEFLSVVDEKIENLKKKKSLLEQYKKALMQQMFAMKTPVLLGQPLKETPKIKDPLEDKPHRFAEPVKSGNSNHTSPFQESTTAGGEGFPQLRFPQFTDNWQEKKLGEVIKFEKKSKRKSGDGQLCGKHKFFVSSQSQTKYIDEVDYKSENLILGTGGNVSIHIAKEFSTSSDTFIFHSKDINVLNRYIYIFLNRERKLLETGFKGMGIKHLSKEFLINFSISLPSVLEQTKIAEFLCSIDDKIANTEAQITKTQLWKKGLLQKMFV